MQTAGSGEGTPDATLCVSHPYPISSPHSHSGPPWEKNAGGLQELGSASEERGGAERISPDPYPSSPRVGGWGATMGGEGGGSSLILKGQAEINQRVRLQSL